MKRIVLSLLFFVTAVAMTACSIETLPRDNSALFEIIESFELPETTMDNLVLPGEFEGATIIWESSDESVISSGGTVVRPMHAVGHREIALTATFILGNSSVEKEYLVTVLSLSEDLSDWLIFAETFAEGFELPFTTISSYDQSIVLPETFMGIPLTWSSSHPATIALDGNEATIKSRLHFDGPLYASLTAKAELMIDGELYDASKSLNVTVMPMTLEDSVAYVTMLIEEEIESYFEGLGDITEDIALPSLIMGYSMTWSSSDVRLIDRRGFVHPPIASEGIQYVTMNVSFRAGGVSYPLNAIDLTILPREDKVVTSVVEVPFVNLADEYIVENGDINIYFMNNQHLPYVDIETFIQLIKGAIVSDEITITVDNGVVTVRYVYVYEIEPEEENGEVNGEEPEIEYGETIYELIADFNENTVIVNRFGFFSAIAESTQTDFGQNLFTIDYVFNASDPVVFDLGYYRFELVQDNDLYLMPLHLANLFFTGSMFDVYFNEDTLYGVDTYQLSRNSVAVQTINTTTVSGEVPYDLKEMTYHFLAFTFDHFYGLKIATEVETYYQAFDSRKVAMFGSSNNHYTSIMRLAYDLDDLHTSHLVQGYYMSLAEFDDQVYLAWFGERMTRFYDAYFGYIQSYCAIPRNVRYAENDTIAFVQIQGFNADTPEDFRDMMLEVDEKGTVEKVVIDLACNTGGIIGTMLQVIGYMTDEPIPYHSMNVGDLSSSSTWVGTETEAFNYEWYILTSPITYSAGNLMTHIAKEMGIATIVGAQSSGGASSITTNILPSGTILIMSSPTVLSDVNYDSIEMGVPVDIEMQGSQGIQMVHIVNAILLAAQETE